MSLQEGNREHDTLPGGSQQTSAGIASPRSSAWIGCLAALFAIFLLICIPGFAARGGIAFQQPSPAGGNANHPPSPGNHNRRPQPPARPHLAQWLRQHNNMTPQEQQRALRNEPGFDRLPVAQQRRLLNRLQQVNAMPPKQRERTLQRMEALEKLSPQQRQQVRNDMREVSQMPHQRQLMMHKAFRDLSLLPPEQRQAVLKSSQFQSEFSGRERQILRTLINVQPYYAAQTPQVQYGGR